MNEMFTMSDSDMNTTTTTKLANKPKTLRKLLSFTQCKQIMFDGEGLRHSQNFAQRAAVWWLGIMTIHFSLTDSDLRCNTETYHSPSQTAALQANCLID